jgi:hypothetical protein
MREAGVLEASRCRGSRSPSFHLDETQRAVAGMITFTGRPSWERLMKSPIIVKPPSPDIETTCRAG